MSLVLLLAVAAQAAAAAPPSAATAKKLAPMSVQVQADAKGGAAAKAFADELRTYIGARKDELRAPKPGEKPELVVRVDSVVPAANGASVMNGALVVGGATHPFNLSYKGPSAPQNEKLARNLRSLAERMKASPPAK
jgi:hypothetical protein